KSKVVRAATAALCQKRTLIILLMLLIQNVMEFKLKCNVTGMIRDSGTLRTYFRFNDYSYN
ncbi:hypothetical protein, partial [Klebsiella michiganensis]